MRILFALPGLHQIDRGAEVAFTSLASELAKLGEEVTLIGSGPFRANKPYSFTQVKSISRDRFERFPKFPPFRHEYAYEEITFVPGFLAAYRPSMFDATITCSFPFTNWILQRRSKRGPAHIFVTQNGDWPAYSRAAEYKLFGCDGLICTNPEFYQRNREQWHCALIPNGISLERFFPGCGDRARFGLDNDKQIVLMASALSANKNVDLGIRAVAEIEDAFLLVAGDGPMRAEIDQLAASIMPSRFKRISVKQEEMPELYRCANAFLHLSKDESFGNVYLEAMATGLPMVVPDTPNVRWIVDERALFVSSAAPSHIAERLRAALSSSEFSTSRSLLADRFSWPVIAKKYQSFLCEVLSLLEQRHRAAVASSNEVAR